MSVRVIDALCTALVCFRLHSPHSDPQPTSVFHQLLDTVAKPQSLIHVLLPTVRSVLLVVSCDVCCQLALGVSLRQGL